MNFSMYFYEIILFGISLFEQKRLKTIPEISNDDNKWVKKVPLFFVNVQTRKSGMLQLLDALSYNSSSCEIFSSILPSN